MGINKKLLNVEYGPLTIVLSLVGHSFVQFNHFRPQLFI